MSTVAVFKAARELEDLFKEHYQLVYRTAFSVTGSKEDAEDVLQTIFAGLLRREVLPPDLKKNPKAYFYRSAFNLSLNVIRYRKRHPSSGEIEGLEVVAPGSESEASDELDKRLYDAIAELHPTAAQIVILRYAHDHSLADIAKLLGTSRSTVAVSLFRSRARLKKLIKASEKS